MDKILNQLDEHAVSIDAVKKFWDGSPLCSHLIDSKPGTKAFFQIFDRMRSEIEPDEFVEAMLSPAGFRGLRVLDVGCGNGYTLSKFSDAGAKVVGMDLSNRALDITKKRGILGGLTLTLFQADARELPFKDGSFDLVYSLGVLHHSPKIDKSFREIHRVLRKGGKTVIMLYNKNSIFYRLRIPAMKYLNRKFRGWTIQQICNHLDGAGNPLGRFFNRRQIQSLMVGFRQLRFQPYYFSYLHFPGKPNIFPTFFCRWLGRHFGWFLYVSAFKD